MNSGQGDVLDAIRTLVLGPFVALAIGVLFYTVARFYWILSPMGTSGPFANAYNTLGTSLSITYELFQLASTLETWIAVAVIGFAAYGFVVNLGGGRGYGGRR
jgi:hypothetical protein